MSEIKKLIEKEISLKFKELKEYSEAYNKKANKNRDDLAGKVKEEFKKNPEGVDIKVIAKDMFYINGFHQTDIRKLQQNLLDIVNFSKIIVPDLDLPEEILDTVKVLKNTLKTQVFTLENSEFKEVEEGTMDKLVSDFEEKGYYKIFEDQIKSLLNE